MHYNGGEEGKGRNDLNAILIKFYKGIISKLTRKERIDRTSSHSD